MSTQFFDKNYMLLCSEKTLQTNKNGFFLDFANAVSDNVSEKWLKNTFGKKKTIKDQIQSIYQDEEIKNYIIEFLGNVTEIYRAKCLTTAEKRLKEARAALKCNNYSKALILFSQSILKMPPSSELFSIAVFERAKVFLHLENYTSALSDFQLAVKDLNFNPNLKGEVFWKMAICYKANHEENKAKVAANLAEKLLADQPKQISLLHESIQQKYDTNLKTEYTKALPEICKKHPVFEHASKKISVKNTPELGNHVVANEAIKTGETLVVEPAYAACLLPEKFGTHCHHCFERLVAPVGCPDCSSLAFCSTVCRDAAVSTYHKYECKYLDLLIGSGMSILSHTALRMITQNTLEKTLEIYKNKSNERIFKLCTNSSKRPVVDKLHRTIMAAFLLRILQKSGYFGKNQESVVATEDQMKIGEMLLHNLQILQFNAHEVYETLYSKEYTIKSSKPSYIGVAIYPTVALFNHDCYPAVTRYFVGKHIVINALRPLGPNDIIAENYGPIFTWRKLIERQRSLSARYWFNCQCLACTEDWPCINSGLDSFQKRIRCPEKNCTHLFSLPTSSIKIRCLNCKKDVLLDKNISKLQWCEDQYEKGLNLVDEKQLDKAVEVFCEALNVFHKISAPPHKLTHLVQDVLRLCLAKNGNLFECTALNKN